MLEKRFTIPTVDVSDRTDWQTIVDREAGQYLGHVTTALMENGKTVYAVYPKAHGLGQIVLKRSDDGGKTWSQRLSVPESWTRSLECPTIYRLVDAAGKSRLFVFAGGYPATWSVSEDGGKTFSEFAPFDFGGIVFISTITCVGPGRYIALFHDEGQFIRGGTETLWEVFASGEGAARKSFTTIRPRMADGTWGEPQKWWVSCEQKPGETWEKVYETQCGRVFDDRHFELYQIETNDGGMTWSQPRVIVSHPWARLCEPCFVPSPDGRQLSVILRENSRSLNSMLITSDDQGRTWSAPVELPAALTGDRHTMRYLPDGRLFITFRDMAYASDTRGDWVAWVGTYDDIIHRREGQYRVLLMRNDARDTAFPADCAYPGLELLADGTLLAVTYGHWDAGEQPYIVAVRIDIDELDQKAQALKKP